jgi:hypothetical protein
MEKSCENCMEYWNFPHGPSCFNCSRLSNHCLEIQSIQHAGWYENRYVSQKEADEHQVAHDKKCEAWEASQQPDMVNHPPHYTNHPSGIECIQITEHMGFLLGNAIKYIWRADLKMDTIEDLKKAVFYIEREIAKREKDNAD